MRFFLITYEDKTTATFAAADFATAAEKASFHNPSSEIVGIVIERAYEKAKK